MARGGSTWQLEDFESKLDDFSEQDDIPVDLRFVILEWLLSRLSDPYQGARRERGEDNLWGAKVPDSQTADGRHVYCYYWIEESRKTVRCSGFGLLTWPM